MKYLITITLCFFGIGTFAQRTLEFNQVKLVTNTQETVPTGKVWKVVTLAKFTDSAIKSSQLSSRSSGSCNYGTYWETCAFYINGNTYNACEFTYRQASSVQGNGQVHFPMWLPAGTTLKTYCSKTLLSVIEFNVTP